jgi:hypothetical protein
MAATEIPRQAREDLLHDIATWPLVLEDVAHRQTRLLRNGDNGDAHLDNGNDSDSSDYERTGIKAENRRKSAQAEKRV